MDATAFWSDHGTGRLLTETLPAVGPNDLRIRTCFSAISKGTETLVFNGAVPISEYERMRAPFQEGTFDGPVKYGYCNVGIVEHGPADWMEQAVFCLYPHQDRYVVPQERVYRLPADLPLERAVLAANMETCVNALADAGLDREINGGSAFSVSIIGAGLVGCLMAHLAKTHGHAVELIDINPDRQGMADVLGVSFSTPENAQTDREVIVHTSASNAGLVQALNLAALEGLIVEMSWFGTTQAKLPLGEAFHSKRLTIRSSQVGHIAPARQASWTYATRFAHALECLKAPELDALITDESPFEALPEVMAQLSRGEATPLCHRIRYSDSI